MRKFKLINTTKKEYKNQDCSVYIYMSKNSLNFCTYILSIKYKIQMILIEK